METRTRSRRPPARALKHPCQASPGRIALEWGILPTMRSMRIPSRSPQSVGHAVPGVVANVALAVALVACSGEPQGPERVRVGSSAPAFELPSAEGGVVSLGELREERPVLLYFSMGPG